MPQPLFKIAVPSCGPHHPLFVLARPAAHVRAVSPPIVPACRLHDRYSLARARRRIRRRSPRRQGAAAGHNPNVERVSETTPRLSRVRSAFPAFDEVHWSAGARWTPDPGPATSRTHEAGGSAFHDSWPQARSSSYPGLETAAACRWPAPPASSRPALQSAPRCVGEGRCGHPYGPQAHSQQQHAPAQRVAAGGKTLTMQRRDQPGHG
jgi:hypothetical protein